MNESNLENVTHEDAVAALKATKEHVKLVISKPSHVPAEVEDAAIAAPPGECCTQLFQQLCLLIQQLYLLKEHDIVVVWRIFIVQRLKLFCICD